MANDNGQRNSLLPFIIGAAVGAFGVFMSDKNNREKVKNKIDEMKDKGQNKAQDLKERGKNALDDLKGKVDEEKNKAEDELNDAQRNM